jgi:translation initiation factor 1 (eIF-1/SUI1)
VPPFEPLQELKLEDGDAPNGGESTAAVAAKKKKGGLVTIVTRKVRGKNVTIVDNLDSWGYTKVSTTVCSHA